ncbi:MAG: hypothetical protein ACR2H2_15325 [Solirubrobacteraceae bacterium]
MQHAVRSPSYFVVMYVGISLPVIAEGLLAEITGLRAAGLVFAAVVAAIAAVALLLLWRQCARRVMSRGLAKLGDAA